MCQTSDRKWKWTVVAGVCTSRGSSSRGKGKCAKITTRSMVKLCKEISLLNSHDCNSTSEYCLSFICMMETSAHYTIILLLRFYTLVGGEIERSVETLLLVLNRRWGDLLCLRNCCLAVGKWKHTENREKTRRWAFGRQYNSLASFSSSTTFQCFLACIISDSSRQLCYVCRKRRNSNFLR